MSASINGRRVGRSGIERARKIIVFVVGVVVATAAFLSLEKPAAGAGSAPVIVTNTPLPVDGTVGAAQSGTWSVGISNSSAQPVPVRSVDEVKKTPFETALCSPAGNPDCPTFHSNNSVTAPADKLLVVEYVSGSCFSTPAGGRVFDINLESNAGQVDHTVVPVQVRNDSVGSERTFAQQTRLYVPPLKKLTLFFTQTSGTDSSCVANISGYLQSCGDGQCSLH